MALAFAGILYLVTPCHLVRYGLSVVTIVPIHGGYPVQLLHAQHWAQVIRNLLQRLLVLLVDNEECDRLHAHTLLGTWGLATKLGSNRDGSSGRCAPLNRLVSKQ